MRSCFEVFPKALNKGDEEQRRSCLVKETTSNGECTEKVLWFSYPADLPMPEDNDCDSYLLAVLLPAMKLQADLTIYGSVSRELLSNLTELQYVWHKWCPQEYALVDIQVAEIRDKQKRVDGAVTAFSGGADAQFTAYRHATGRAGYRTQDLRAGVLVHGFDIPLADAKGFASAQSRACIALSDLGLRLIAARTNISQIWKINWEYYCGTALAAVLSGLNRYAGTGLIGSSDPYDKLFAAWGSHPITDPLLSSGAFRIIHDGAGFCRTEKIKAIAQWPRGTQSLRVCWQGVEKDRNCGICEKCVRTRINFLIAGTSNPDCFSTPLKTEHLKNLRLSCEPAVRGWIHLYQQMLDADVDSQWVQQIEKIIKRKPGGQLTALFPLGTRRRTVVKQLRDQYLEKFKSTINLRES